MSSFLTNYSMTWHVCICLGVQCMRMWQQAWAFIILARVQLTLQLALLYRCIQSCNIGTHRANINLKPSYPRLNWGTDGPHPRSQVLVIIIIILLNIAFNYLCGLLVLHTMHGDLMSIERSLYSAPHVHPLCCMYTSMAILIKFMEKLQE